MSAQANLKSVMIAIFRRKGEITCGTQPVDAGLPIGVRVALAAAGSTDELPVLFSVNDAGGLVLLTTRGIITAHDCSVWEIPYAEIAEVGADMAAENRRGHRSKSTFAILSLTLRSGETIHVETEPGMPYWGILNAVEFAVRRSRAEQGRTP